MREFSFTYYFRVLRTPFSFSLTTSLSLSFYNKNAVTGFIRSVFRLPLVYKLVIPVASNFEVGGKKLMKKETRRKAARYSAIVLFFFRISPLSSTF